MKILIDIVHPADVNFYKNAIKDLIEKGHEVIITVRPRGKLIDILKSEINIPINIIGKHYTSKIGKILGIIIRNIKLYFFLRKIKPEVVSGFGSFYIAMASKTLGIKSVIFYDDPEYKQAYNLCKKYATIFVVPNSVEDNGANIIHGFDFKESAYLHPKYFKPSLEALKEYNLKPEQYVFVREIANISLNYNNQDYGLDSVIRSIKKKNLKIVLSLEDKSLTKKYEKDCIILTEPVKDIYSIIYFSKIVVTSGDTLAREAAIMGKHTFFTGKRKMKINDSLIRTGYLHTSSIDFNMAKKKHKSYKCQDVTQEIIRLLK